MFLNIFWMLPVIVNSFTPLNTLTPIEVTVEGISIRLSDKQPKKAQFPIDDTNDWIDIISIDVHLLNAPSPIEYKE